MDRKKISVIANRFGDDCSKMEKTEFDNKIAQEKTEGKFILEKTLIGTY